MSYIFSEEVFTNPDNWAGGFYELALEFSPSSAVTLDQALQTLWHQETLVGCYAEHNNVPSHQRCVLPSLQAIEELGHLFGLATLPNGATVPCGCYIVREDDASDWLNFYIPMGVLSVVYNVQGFPFSSEHSTSQSDEWRIQVDSWLLALSQSIYAHNHFALGLIGFEVSGTAYSHTIETMGVPPHRWMGYVQPIDSFLLWHSPTETGAQFMV